METECIPYFSRNHDKRPPSEPNPCLGYKAVCSSRSAITFDLTFAPHFATLPPCANVRVRIRNTFHYRVG